MGLKLRFETYKKLVIFSFALFFVVGIALIPISFAASSSNAYSAIMYFSIALVQMGFSIAFFPRMRGKNVNELGETVMQHAWWIFSDALVAILIFTAPFFHIGLWTYLTVACSLIWLLLGLLMIIITNRAYEVPLSV
jgi:hypothetical protein